MASPNNRLVRKVRWTKERIHELRATCGMTQEEFAHTLGVTWVSVSRWENGHSIPQGLSIAALDLLAVKVGVAIHG